MELKRGNRRVNIRLPLLFSLTLLLTSGATELSAQETDEILHRGHAAARLTGFQEVPSVVTSGRGVFHAEFTEDAGEITYSLEYSDLEGDVTEALIHLVRSATDGGVVVFLCSYMQDSPNGIQACPPAPAEISGTITAEDVQAIADQGVEAGNLEDLLRSIRARATYVNVYTDAFPDGEIRGQIRRARRFRRDAVDVDDVPFFLHALSSRRLQHFVTKSYA